MPIFKIPPLPAFYTDRLPYELQEWFRQASGILSGKFGIPGIDGTQGISTGQLGEILTAATVSGTALVGGVVKQVNTLSLTAGTWSIYGAVDVTSVTVNDLLACQTSITSAAFVAGVLGKTQITTNGALQHCFAAPVYQITCSGATPVYLNAYVAVGGATCDNAYLQARRVA